MKKKLLFIIAFLTAFIVVNDQRSFNGSYILQFPGDSFENFNPEKTLTLANCQIIRTYKPEQSQYVWLEIQTSHAARLPKLIRKLQQDYNLLYFERAYRPRLAATPNDPYYQHGGQEYLKRLGIESAWEHQAGKSRIKVAIIDTGADTLHPDLEHFFRNKGEIPYDSIDNDKNGYVDDLVGWNFINESNNPDDDNGHGTHVAGIIGATTGNNKGIAGIAGGGFVIKGKAQSGVILIPLKTANKTNQHGSNIVIARAIDLAVSYGARIINLSLQTTADHPVENDPLYQSCSRAAAAGVVLIAASGNSGDPQYANVDNWNKYSIFNNHPQVVSVSATEVDKNGVVTIAKWRNRDGKTIYACYGSTVTLSAPGEEILSCVPTSLGSAGAYARFSGTSMAAGFVSGAASLILSKNFRLSNRQVINILQGSCTPLYVYGGGSGEINFKRALRLTPSILEPFIEISEQLLKGFPKNSRKRAKRFILRSQKNLKDIDESSFYDLRIALLQDFFQKKWAKAP